MAPSRVYGPPDATPDPDFERRLFPVSFFSRSSHFCSLLLTVSQRGAFGGLLPGHKAMPLKRAISHLFRGEDEEDIRLAKRAVKGMGLARDEVLAGPSVSAPPATKGKGKGKGKGKAVPPAAGRICLRCSKRIHLDGESTTRGVTVPVGFRCDLSAFRKCSYCAHTHHDCEGVSWFPAFSGAR